MSGIASNASLVIDIEERETFSVFATVTSLPEASISSLSKVYAATGDDLVPEVPGKATPTVLAPTGYDYKLPAGNYIFWFYLDNEDGGQSKASSTSIKVNANGVVVSVPAIFVDVVYCDCGDNDCTCEADKCDDDCSCGCTACKEPEGPGPGDCECAGNASACDCVTCECDTCESETPVTPEPIRIGGNIIPATAAGIEIYLFTSTPASLDAAAAATSTAVATATSIAVGRYFQFDIAATPSSIYHIYATAAGLVGTLTSVEILTASITNLVITLEAPKPPVVVPPTPPECTCDNGCDGDCGCDTDCSDGECDNCDTCDPQPQDCCTTICQTCDCSPCTFTDPGECCGLPVAAISDLNTKTWTLVTALDTTDETATITSLGLEIRTSGADKIILNSSFSAEWKTFLSGLIVGDLLEITPATTISKLTLAKVAPGVTRPITVAPTLVNTTVNNIWGENAAALIFVGNANESGGLAGMSDVRILGDIGTGNISLQNGNTRYILGNSASDQLANSGGSTIDLNNCNSVDGNGKWLTVGASVHGKVTTSSGTVIITGNVGSPLEIEAANVRMGGYDSYTVADLTVIGNVTMTEDYATITKLTISGTTARTVAFADKTVTVNELVVVAGGTVTVTGTAGTLTKVTAGKGATITTSLNTVIDISALAVDASNPAVTIILSAENLSVDVILATAGQDYAIGGVGVAANDTETIKGGNASEDPQYTAAISVQDLNSITAKGSNETTTVVILNGSTGGTQIIITRLADQDD